MRIVCLLLGALYLASCYTPRYMYSPSAQNVPILTKQGDSKISAAYSSNLSQKTYNDDRVNESRSRGYDLQGAVAITNNFAIQANYFKRIESNNGYRRETTLDSSNLNYKRNLTEIGIGYYKPFSESGRAIFQVFGGVGKGRFSFTDYGTDLNSVSYSRFHQADITKYYIQPAIIFRTRRSFAGSISSRFSIIRYSNIKTDYTPAEQADFRLDSLSLGARTFWEPAITNSFGFKKLPGLRIEYQVGVALLMSRRPIDYRSFNFSLGLVLDIPKLFMGPESNDR